MKRILVVLGQTATGKSLLAVELAKQFGGEIISADSRQIYKGLDIGTGKITEEEMGGIPHCLIDTVDPNNEFSVVDFKHLAEIAISDITRRKKLPIVVGGTGFYIKSIVDNIVPPRVPPNKKLRDELEKKDVQELLDKLKSLDPDRAVTIEPNNKRRIIRAIEIATYLGSVPRIQTPNPNYEILQIGLGLPDNELKTRIRVRVKERLEQGWVEEVKKLLKAKVTENRLHEFGLGYAIIAETLKRHSNVRTNIRIDLHEKENKKLVERIATSEWQYAKRQKRWFKRDKKIKWFYPSNMKKIEKSIQKFLSGKNTKD